MTASEVARRLRLYRSNLSATDAGRRPISLRTLGRIAVVLGCSLGDLLDLSPADDTPVFRDRRLAQRLKARDLGTSDGLERGWVHAAQLAWRRHYGSPGRPA